VRAIDVVFNFSGGLLDLKGFPGHHRPAVSVDALKPRAVLQRLTGDPDDRWIFTPDRVWIERRDGEIVEERSHPRAAFAGHDRNTPWDRLHLTYFLGYAIWFTSGSRSFERSRKRVDGGHTQQFYLRARESPH